MVKKNSGSSLTEKQMGYLFVLPALIIILVIAIWPVVRSFWISLYDIRLNDPAKAAIHRSYGIDMEQYVDTIPYVLNDLQKERESANPGVRQELQTVQQKAEKLKNEINSESQVAARYPLVEKMLSEYQVIPDNVKYAEISAVKAGQIKSEIKNLEFSLVNISGKHSLKNQHELLGLLHGLEVSLINPNFIGLAHYSSFRYSWACACGLNVSANRDDFAYFHVFAVHWVNE
ncbi:hypothetical protein [Aneurinibacillus terranovensis]|uniref:hypothetical protein n=1 Tax=Aneurinibacillus terranovensis TaxID=278991 RepID=UPI0003F666E8|nr:hypothetical protein [Aneurinibacillus terranovensis]